MAHNNIRDFMRRIQAAAPSGYFVDVTEPMRNEDRAWRSISLIKRNNPDATAEATLEVQSLPGCCGVVILHNFRSYGKAAMLSLMKLIEAATTGAQRVKYGQAILTLLVDSELIPLLEHAGWGKASVFLNGKTDNRVSVLMKELPQTPRPQRRNNTGGE